MRAIVPLLGAVFVIQTLAPPIVQTRATPRSVIDGVVTDTNLVSLADATISILGSKIRVTTGASGHFRVLSLPSGSYLVVVHRVGYTPLSALMRVGAGDTLRTSFMMRPIATALDTMVTTATHLSTRMQEFDARRRGGFGTFITVDEIERRNSTYFVDLIANVPSIKFFIPSGTRMFEEYAASTRNGGNCPMRVFVDGVLLPSPANLYDLPSPKELAGVEIYPGPESIPLQYKTGESGCGVLLVWTKDGG